MTSKANQFNKASNGIKVTFTPKVTRDELIASLDQILNQYGCPACGLNGMDQITLASDPDPLITNVKGVLLNDRFKSVINVETITSPVQQSFGF